MKRPIYSYTDEMMTFLLVTIALLWVFLILI
jgi:hypothetical protein